MATLTAADMFADYPELTTTDADDLTRIANFLDVAETTVVEGFDTIAKRDRCRLAVAAHLTSLSNSDNCSSSSGARSGAVTGRTRGSRSVQYSSPESSHSLRGFLFGSTRYARPTAHHPAQAPLHQLDRALRYLSLASLQPSAELW
ncbi:MAG: DUF4054 domain-containing protein [Marivivens sp.]|nr:DUF4054 domain-containing protein [Marivivens sp.]